MQGNNWKKSRFSAFYTTPLKPFQAFEHRKGFLGVDFFISAKFQKLPESKSDP